MHLNMAARQSYWRRLAGVTLGLALVLTALPSLALAAKPTQLVTTLYSTAPPRITTADGSLDFSLSFPDTSTPHAFFSFWETGKIPGQELGLSGFLIGIGVEGDVVSGQMLVFDDTIGEVVGTATFTLAFTPNGDAEHTYEVQKAGNLRTEWDILFQPMSVAGSLELPDGTAIPIAASGTKDVYAISSNMPAGTVFDGNETFFNASWIVDGREFILRFIETALSSESYAYVIEESGAEIVGRARPRMSDGRIVAEYALERAGQLPAGTASADVTVSEIRSFSYFETAPGFIQRVVEDEIAVSGSVTFVVDGETVELSLADATIDAHQYAWHGVQRPLKDDGGEGEG